MWQSRRGRRSCASAPLFSGPAARSSFAVWNAGALIHRIRAMQIKTLAVAALAAAFVTTAAADAFAQGCILLRQTSPLFGTTGSLDQEVGSWTITFSGRSSIADQHYRGEEYQAQRELEQTYVVNRQNSVTTTVGYQMTPRVSFVAGIPFVEASWGIP